jgi:hypothetical protein
MATNSYVVEMWMDRASMPVVHDATSTYQKGDMFCVRDTKGNTYKYPVVNIFRVIEIVGGDK